MKPDTQAESGAEFDSSGRYRYRLWRRWGRDGLCLAVVMLNPSTADAVRDDPTLRRCIDFARSWGFSSLEVVNLFAYRATSPRELRRAADPIGPDNDRYLLAAVRRAHGVVAAWGNWGALLGRDRVVRDMLGYRAVCLGLTAQGQPRHPLYVRADCPPTSLSRCGGVLTGATENDIVGLEGPVCSSASRPANCGWVG